MKIIAYRDLCKKQKQKKVHIYCSPKVFKPLVLIMGAAIFMLILNLFVNNFFSNIHASVQHFIDSFVKTLIFK